VGFEAIRDQEVAVKMLRTALRKRRLPHAYLFEGPDSVGKRLTALTFARAVNCGETDDDSCDACGSCLKIGDGKHPDVTVVEPTKAGRIIHKQRVEELVASASLKPYEAAYRVFIILEAERMNVVSANKFLKTLEEPPGNSLFVLVSHSPNQLLPTIASRCQRVKFRPLTPRTVEDLLIRERDVPQERARVISVLAQGQMSTAFELADSEKREFVAKLIGDLADRRDPLLVVREFLGRLKKERDQIKESLGNEEIPVAGNADDFAERQEARHASIFRKELLSYLDLLRVWYRDVLVFAETGRDERLWNADSVQMVADLAERQGRTDIEQKVDAVARAQMLLEHNVNEERVFKELFFSLAG
jgi:DNA polymerase-3 subunit delta'